MRAKENIFPGSKLAGIVLCLICLAQLGCAGFSAQKVGAPATAFSISGMLNPAMGASGTTVTLSGAARATTAVDSSGNYTFSGLPRGSYTVTPTKKGSTFSPATQGIIVNESNVTGVNFSASQPPAIISISGSISPAANGTATTVTLSGATNATATTDSSGNYTFSGLSVGSYTLTPNKTGFTFSPSSRRVTASGTDVTGVDFGVNQPQASISISGSISPAATGGPTTVTLIGVTSATATTDSSGNYTFSGLPAGSYTLTPSKKGFTFSPSVRLVTASSANLTGVDFTVNQPPVIISISGFISPAATGAATTVTLSGATSATATTDRSGKYTFSGLPAGSYTLTPSKTGFTFSPSVRLVTASSANLTGVDFTVNQPPVIISISGFISPAATGAATTVTLSGATSATATTDRSGKYTFSGLSAGSYTLTPSKTGFTFSPSTRTVTASNANLTGINFTAGSAGQRSGPLVINGQNGTIIEGLRITSSSGTCVTILNSTNITIQNSEIGPCAGNGIAISGGSGINIFDSYIHPETLASGCCDHNDGIFAWGGTHDLLIQGNVIAYGESNIEIQGGQTVTVTGNFLLNPRDQQSSAGPRGSNFQCWNHCSNVVVQNNYALSSLDTTRFLYPEATEDSLNFGVTTGFVAQNNFLSGGHSQYGCGIMADTFSNNGQILNNQLLNTGQCGIGITDGSQVANGNKVHNVNPVKGGGNTAMYVAHYGQSNICGPMTIAENIADEDRANGTHSGWWNRKDCGTIDISTDTFSGPAHQVLTPESGVFVPPLIPPQPKNCVVTSPYSTQTSSPPCIP